MVLERQHEPRNQSSMNMPALPPIEYTKTEIDGIPARPDSRAIMQKAVDGHPINVYSGNDYINLYHVWDRMVARRPKQFRDLRIVRVQIGNSHWQVFILGSTAKIPDLKFDDGYNPKRGRYKRLAQELRDTGTVVVGSKTEAIKARRAWQLYVPSEKRRALKSSIVKVGRTTDHAVVLKDR